MRASLADKEPAPPRYSTFEPSRISGGTSRLALKYRLPSIATTAETAEAGLLMTYGPDNNENARRIATVVDKIFKGAKPGEIPFELPTRYYLIINRGTAKALGITIPREMLLRADRVID